MNDPATTISPKVIASAVTSVILIAVVAAIGAITPDLFAGLGAWSGVVYASVVAAGGAVAAYLKGDPLRK